MGASLRHPVIRRLAALLLGLLLLGLWLRPALSQTTRHQAVMRSPVLILRAGTGHEGHRVPARHMPGWGGVAPQAFQPSTNHALIAHAGRGSIA